MRIPVAFHRALLNAVEHDCLNLAQSAAYSAMFSLFPALVVTAAIIALLPDSIPLRASFGAFFERILPPDVLPTLDAYFDASPHHGRSVRALALAAFFSMLGASGVMATLMEGLRRASELPENCWSFGQRRRRALLLVPLSLVPFAIASILVVFGHWITFWLAYSMQPDTRLAFYLLAEALRWVVALAGVVGVNAIIYHLGTPHRQRWYRTLPGALVSTGMWFVVTLAFGWYVTRFANYSVIYGSLGSGMALLVWLSIIFLSVLTGAEFNRQITLQRERRHADVAE
ncbi:membrane protein [Granulicella rosea]|uniref:Membrane protein n=1 Tax=Granulicella rosea TaxID=474952 RepID=A0A239ME91_9BACT|nr:YihY/virulence factor BrkB family protein [Granulicella rosea]SNT40288.1 membrane protein [Granulicella rosea]